MARFKPLWRESADSYFQPCLGLLESTGVPRKWPPPRPRGATREGGLSRIATPRVGVRFDPSAEYPDRRLNSVGMDPVNTPPSPTLYPWRQPPWERAR